MANAFFYNTLKLKLYLIVWINFCLYKWTNIGFISKEYLISFITTFSQNQGQEMTHKDNKIEFSHFPGKAESLCKLIFLNYHVLFFKSRK